MASDKARGLKRNLTNYGDRDFAIYLRRSFARSMGYSKEMLERPIVGIAQTGSGFNNCHRNMPELVEAVKRGVLAAGGLPLEFPTISLGEIFLSPTSMMFRNLMSMDVEEMIRAQPMDAVVLIGGCDKTVPALLMGAASAGLPAIALVTGAMLTGSHDGVRVGACTDCRRYWGRFRAQEIDEAELARVNNQLVASVGFCSVMGTASTMACVTEGLGMMLPGGATPPAVTADRIRIAEKSGATAVAMANSQLTPARILSAKTFENALRVLLAIGGSTNGIIHLTAIAGRLGIKLDLDRLDALGRETPVLVDLKPSGSYYMEDFHKAGGMPALLRELRPLLHLDVLTVTGRTLGEELDDAVVAFPQDVVRTLAHPIYPQGGIAVLRGNLAPNGALIKQSAADPKLFERVGRAVVFESLDDLAARIDAPDLDVTADDFLVLQNAGPKSGYAMPEAGYLPIPTKLSRAGVKDMVRISDARMSGTAFGTIVLHVSPEAAVGGPLALVKNGDRIKLSVKERRIDLLVAPAELEKRKAQWQPRTDLDGSRGYRKLHLDHVLQAEHGCDLDFMRLP